MWTFEPFSKRADGVPRRVGIEMEFCGLPLVTIEQLLLQAGGENLQRKSDYLSEVDMPGIGTVKIEFDARIFSEMKVRKVFADW